jgi:hypothetical protein
VRQPQLTLTVCEDTFDYLFAPGVTKPRVVAVLRGVADLIETGIALDNPVLT